MFFAAALQLQMRRPLLVVAVAVRPRVRCFAELQAHRKVARRSDSPRRERVASNAPSFNDGAESRIEAEDVEGEASSAPVDSSLALWKDQESVSQASRTAVMRGFGFKTMTPVQKAVMDLLPTHNDLLVKAKTGTGKTLAFLVAAMECVEAKTGIKSGSDIPILALSPTRELANQIYKESIKLFGNERGKAVSVVGGDSKARQLEGINPRFGGRPNLVVATPGRLIDLLETNSMVRDRLRNVKVLILDECDTLLDMGFQVAIEKITSYLNNDRQTLLFSATVSQRIRGIAARTLKPAYKEIDTVPKNDVPTHLNVKQSYVIAPFSHTIATLVHAIETHRAAMPNAKIIVFLNTTRGVQHLSAVLSGLPKMDIMCLHSKLDQRQRSRVSDRFRAANTAILVTTDISARGVDYPGVTYVVQVGVPSAVDQYIHRIGRTGRAGKSGEGLIILSNLEKEFVPALTRAVPVKQSLDIDSNVVVRDESLLANIKLAMSQVEREGVSNCYGAFLGFYKQQARSLGWSDEGLVRVANEYATEYLGLDRIPSISAKTALNLGLTKVRGITIGRDRPALSSFDDDKRDGGRPGFKGGERFGYGDSSSFRPASGSRFGGREDGGRGDGGHVPRSKFGHRGGGRGGDAIRSDFDSQGEVAASSSRSDFGSSRGGYESSSRSDYGSSRGGGQGGKKRSPWEKRGRQ